MNSTTKYLIITSVGVAVLGVILQPVWPQCMAIVIDCVMRAVNVTRSTLYGEKVVVDDTAQRTPAAKRTQQERLFTPDQLRKYDGSDGKKGPYIAILGRVYNVRKGKKHYGPGGGYEFFAGRDGSRAFVTGDFTEAGLVDDISGLTSADYIGLDEWVKFYDTDYKYVGKLIGRYYDEKGESTSYYYDVQRWIAEAFRHKENEDEEKKRFPPCNSEWSPESGTRVWCTERSGGVHRDWVGVPRKFYNPGQNKPRCACVKGFGPPSHDPTRMPHDNKGDLDNPHVEEYAGCEPDQPTCQVKEG